MKMSKLQGIIRLLMVLFALAVSGCEKNPEITHTTYQEEMISFIADSQEGRELFSQNLYPDSGESFTQSYYKLFYDFDSVKRTYKVDIAEAPHDIYSHNSIYDAVVNVNDYFYGKMSKIVGIDTTIYHPVEINLNRFAYFLKLYTDNYAYHGWRFWGYSVDNLTLLYYGTFTSRSGKSFSAYQSGDLPDSNSTLGSKLGFYYITKNSITKLPPGDSLTYRTSLSYRTFAETGDGKRRLIEMNGDEGGWRMPSSSDKFYRLITLEGPFEFRIDTTGTGPSQVIDTVMIRNSDVIIPFKVDI